MAAACKGSLWTWLNFDNFLIRVLSAICHNADMDSEALYLYILSRLPVKQISQWESWRSQIGSFEKLFFASRSELLGLGWSPALIDRLNKEKLNFSVEELAKGLEQAQIAVLPYYDQFYPKLLQEIFDPPSVLFYRGLLLSTDEACVGVVGTRQISSYGRAILPRLTEPLIASKVTIVSGLAYGVDAAAHSEAVKNQARTIAVLGSGLDNASLYPRQHVRLAEEILTKGGLLLSEHPPGMPALKQHFIARNRIIAGLSLGIIIVECKLKSGALITADYAMDFNRRVYAVPGPIYSPFSAGPHKLINDGAMLIQSGQEVLEDLNLQIAQSPIEQPNFSELQQRVLKCMQSTPLTIDSLQTQLNLSTQELISALTELELLNAVHNLGAAGFIKTWTSI